MKVAIIGTGLMGMGIAQVFATHGDSVSMCVVTGSNYEKKEAKFRSNVQRLVSKGKLSQEACDEVCSHVRFGGLELAADVDLVVESALENMEAKIELFQRLDPICRPDTMFTTNTSSLSIGCCPSCFVMSMTSTATPKDSTTAFFRASGSPTAVITQRL